jgi:hypothetical protein
MTSRARWSLTSFAALSLAIPLTAACSADVVTDDGMAGVGGTGATAGTSGSGGKATGGTAGATSGGSGGTTTAGSGGTGGGSSGTTGVGGGSSGTGGSASGAGGTGVGAAGAGGTVAGASGTGNGGTGAGTGGAAGSAGTATAGTGGGTTPEWPPLDCGPIGHAEENAGPPGNRVNYVILGDGYTASEVDTVLMEHIDYAMEKRFSSVIGQPYLRYRKFVNICVLKIESPGSICGNSALDCCGDDGSRLANCNRNAANQAIEENLPESFEVDWKAVVLNGDSWWNTGSDLMLWSGGHQDAHGAALHEGGHGFHQLADEYTSNANDTREYGEVNSTASPLSASNPKWGEWVGFMQSPGTGEQDFFEGSRYATSGQYRPSDNSMMNMLFGDDEDTSFNSVSREKMVMDVWRACVPVDSTVPPEGAVSNPATLTVNVIDPMVINVDWSVDGTVVAPNGGTVFNVAGAGLAAGTHTITARAYDNADETLVRYRDGGNSYGRMNWSRSEQEVSWEVTIP